MIENLVVNENLVIGSYLIAFSWGAVGKWFAYWIIPGLLLGGWAAADKAKKAKFEHFDSEGKSAGHSEYETGEIEKGSPEVGAFLLIAWLVCYPLFWIFYGWWAGVQLP